MNYKQISRTLFTRGTQSESIQVEEISTCKNSDPFFSANSHMKSLLGRGVKGEVLSCEDWRVKHSVAEQIQ